MTLRNRLPAKPLDLPGYNTLPMIVNNFNSNQVAPSRVVGLHPEMLSLNVLNSDGYNVGLNPPQTASPGNKVSYQWYAGVAWIDPNTNNIVHTPVEFGSVSLMPADPIKQASKGAVGALIIEPQGATWTVDPQQPRFSHRYQVGPEHVPRVCTGAAEQREHALTSATILSTFFRAMKKTRKTRDRLDSTTALNRIGSARAMRRKRRLRRKTALVCRSAPRMLTSLTC